MKVLVVYDSFFSNTEQVAKAIGKSLGSKNDVSVLQVKEDLPVQLNGLNLLIVGSPTRAFRPTKAIVDFIKKIPSNGLNGVKAAAFDTRISIKDIKSSFLNVMVKLFGYAARPIAEKLKKKGGELIVSPEGFYVKDTKGPLKDGELKRASEWIKF